MDIEIPIDLAAEQAVLGAILSKPELFEQSRLVTEAFYDGRHQSLHQIMQDLQEQELPIDLISITNHSDFGKIGSVTYLMELRDAVPTVANFGYYVGIVHDKYLKRKAIAALSKKLDESDEYENPSAFLSDIQESMNSIADEMKPQQEFISIREMLPGYDEEIYHRREQKGLVGVKTAGTDLDKLTGGHMKQDFIIVAARPSIGKTAFMLNTVNQAADSGTACGVFSLEMPALKLLERMICMNGNIDGSKIKTGMLDIDDWARYTMAASKLSELPILIDDTPGITVQEIGAKVKKLKKQYGKIMIFIDYLQLISGGKKFPNTQEEVKFVSKYLKRIARENDCPLMAISSLSRRCEERQDKRPMMSDLRDSGQIEFDADDVILLYRDDYYNQESEKKNIVEIQLAKGRNTGTGLVEMVYLKNYSKFIDLDRSHHESADKPSRENPKKKWA